MDGSTIIWQITSFKYMVQVIIDIGLSTRTLLHDISYEMELEITFQNKLNNFSTTDKSNQKNYF
jgi:hypothetical protein